MNPKVLWSVPGIGFVGTAVVALSRQWLRGDPKRRSWDQFSTHTRCLPKTELVFPPNFGLFLDKRAATHRQAAVESREDMLLSYGNALSQMFVYDRLALFQDPRQWMFNVLGGLLADSDADRSREIFTYLSSHGCNYLNQLQTCIDKLSFSNSSKVEDILISPDCERLEKSLGCIERAARARGRQFHGSLEAELRNTHTDLDRTMMLIDGLRKAKEVEPPTFFPKRPRNLLIVGPGLETITGAFGVSIPQQTYEPFAMIDFVLGEIEGELDKLEVTLVDINPRVLQHLQGLVQKGNSGRDHSLFVDGKDASRFGRHLPGVRRKRLHDTLGHERREELKIPAPVLRRLEVLEGDITTDRLGERQGYDLVVMMNVFLYLSPLERALALDNIADLLRPGGVLITDHDSQSLPIDYLCGSMPGRLKPGHEAGYKTTREGESFPIVLWKAEGR